MDDGHGSGCRDGGGRLEGEGHRPWLLATVMVMVKGGLSEGRSDVTSSGPDDGCGVKVGSCGCG